jgi:hypothetical protein
MPRPRPTPRPRPAARLLRAALLVALVAPGAAHAQFGGLRRRLESRLEKAAAGEPSAPAAPAFSDRVLEITDARLDQLLAGLRVEAADAERERREQGALDAKAAAHEQAQQAHARCAEPFAREQLRLTGMLMGLAVAAKREQERTGGAAGPMQDSLTAVTRRAQKLSADLTAKCGPGPGPSPFEAMREGGDADAEGRAARAAGLAPGQYAVLRERAAAWVLAADGRTGRYAFAAGERAVLERRAAALAPYRALLGA